MGEEEKKLVKMIQRADIPFRNSYNVSEAAKIIGVSQKALERMVKEYEVVDGLKIAGTLQGFLARATTRVSRDELVLFFENGAKVIYG